MARKVTYRGTGQNTLRPHAYQHREGDDTYLLVQGEPQEVPDEVAAALAQLPGDRFDIETATTTTTPPTTTTPEGGTVNA